MLVDVLESYEKEHGELTDKWRELDKKAQGIAAISGIFVAGILAFIPELSAGKGCAIKILLSISVTSLFFSVLFTLVVIKIRKVSDAPMGKFLEDMTKDLTGKSWEDDPSRYHNFIRDQTKAWSSVNSEMKNNNDDKVESLIRAQWALTITVLLLILVAVISIWSKWQ
jgi:membrane-bound ClpP family serine protease